MPITVFQNKKPSAFSQMVMKQQNLYKTFLVLDSVFLLF